MSVPPLLQRFVDDELHRAADLISRTCSATLEQLRQPRDHLLTSSERQHYFELVQVLQSQQGVYQKAFVETLRRLVLADMGPATQAEAGNVRPSGLQLMDETRVESDIEISRAIQQIDSAAEWELRELQTFTSTLRGQPHVTAESNPLRPQSYARALWEAGTALPITAVQQSILLRVAATVMGGLLRTAFAAASSRLEAQGIEPGIYRTVVIAPGAGRDAPPEMDVTRPGALDGLMRSMPGGGDAGPITGNEPKRRVLPTTTPALEQALLRVEELLRRMPTGDAAAVAASPPPLRLAQHRAALMATAGETVDRQIIELLSRLFETILSDRSLSTPLQGAIARLQVSALRIALLDPSMLDAYDHPVWQLLDRIVTAATTYPHPYDTRLIALQDFCDKLVQQMAAAPQQDSALYRHSLGRLDAFLADQLRRQQRDAEPNVEALVRAEQAEALQRTLAGRLVEQMTQVPASPTLRRFITGTWSHVLTQSVQQHGDQSPQTTGYLKTVDELLWSLKLPDHPKSRQRLLELLPGLLQRLRDGMALVQLPPAEQQAVFDELMKVHSEALRPGTRAAQARKPDEQLTPEEIVQRMREEPQPELPEPDPLDGSAFSDSLIDLASLETVPAALMDSTEPGSSADEARQWVQRMALGERYRLFLHGAWTCVQLLWRSDQGHFFLFAGELPQQTHSVSLRALERLRAEKLLRPLHEQPLIQRAVDGLLLNLARPI
ncbi:DUF1631 family protein [Piscinibacter sp. HJYY11]|uniref:DUF1631 family protein n=1 Tax=Piscinibacter sp. HJYY11 TaxID=2801333 RepID=UPI00191CD15D|nr:DUF1631 family protein [Piscinibacter sp. HJYY11]MBL0730115.1 DUF1631 family protein [Piscinibacter sp. HJYY11]